MRRSFHFLVITEMAVSEMFFDWTKQLLVSRGQIRTVHRILQHLKLQLVETFNSVDSTVRPGIFVQYCNNFSIVILCVCFELLVSTGLKSFRYNRPDYLINLLSLLKRGWRIGISWNVSCLTMHDIQWSQVYQLLTFYKHHQRTCRQCCINEHCISYKDSK